MVLNASLYFKNLASDAHLMPCFPCIFCIEALPCLELVAYVTNTIAVCTEARSQFVTIIVPSAKVAGQHLRICILLYFGGDWGGGG